MDTVAADLDAADLISGDEVKLIKTGATGTFNEEDVDTAIPVTTIGFDITGEDAVNYALIQPSTTADITPAILTISDVTANSKIYDGTDVANLNSVAVLNGVFSPDVVTLHTDDATAIFENKNAGVNKTVIVDGFTLEGTDTGNYSLTQPEYVKANISQRVLAITAKADNKEYDGTLVAVIPVGGFTMDNLVSPDEAVTVSATARFEEKDADEDKTVNITGITLGGTGAGNYTSNTVTTTIADITPATLKVTGVTAASRYIMVQL